MKRIVLAALAVAAGTTAALAHDPGDYHFHDTLKPHGRERSVHVLQANAVGCMARTGHPNLASEMPAMMRDPAYTGCLAQHGWKFYAWTPSKHRSYAHRSRRDDGPYEPPTPMASDSVQSNVDAMNQSITESNTQNAAWQ